MGIGPLFFFVERGIPDSYLRIPVLFSFVLIVDLAHTGQLVSVLQEL